MSLRQTQTFLLLSRLLMMMVITWHLTKVPPQRLWSYQRQVPSVLPALIIMNYPRGWGSNSGNSDSLPPPPVSEPITFERRRVKNRRKHEKVNDARPAVLPTFDPNDNKAADVSESLKQSQSQKHSLKRKRSQEDMVYEGDNELYDVPSELREDIVGKDNKLLLHPNEAITRRTRSKKKTKLRYIHPEKPSKPFFLSPNELEKCTKAYNVATTNTSAGAHTYGSSPVNFHENIAENRQYQKVSRPTSESTLAQEKGLNRGAVDSVICAANLAVVEYGK